MKAFELYKVTQTEIIPAKQITPEDIALVLDKENKFLYVYKGKYSIPFDEFRSTKLFERIINRFLNPNVYLLKTIIPKEKDEERIIKIKEFIINHYPNLKKYEFSRKIKNIFHLKSIREQIRIFKSYENSRVWRSKLSNLTNIWRLSAFNAILLIGAVIVLLAKIILDTSNQNFIFISGNTIDTDLFNLWRENLNLILGLLGFILAVGFIVNLVFILFPMKFPISPLDYGEMKKESKLSSIPQESGEVKAPKLPPTIKTPDMGKGIKSPQIAINLKKKDDYKPTLELEDDLGIPDVPLKKKMKNLGEIKLNSQEVEDLSRKDTKETKFIIIDCPICKKNLSMPVPRKLVLDSEEPVVEVSYIHGDPNHVLVAQLDHDFDVRRRRASWAVFETDF